MEIHRDVPDCDPRLAHPLRYRPLLDLRAMADVEHDVDVPDPGHAIAHRGEGEVGCVWLLEGLDLRRVVREARGAVPRAQNEGAAVWDGE